MLPCKRFKNQLTVPKEIVGNFPGIDLFAASVEDNRIILTPVTASLDSIRTKMERLGITGDDVTETVQWAGK